jgi:hypothetical protein
MTQAEVDQLKAMLPRISAYLVALLPALVPVAAIGRVSGVVGAGGNRNRPVQDRSH